MLRILEAPGSSHDVEAWNIYLLRGFTQLLHKICERCLKLGHDRFLPLPFQFIIH
jgi:hypothetical protein